MRFNRKSSISQGYKYLKGPNTGSGFHKQKITSVETPLSAHTDSSTEASQLIWSSSKHWVIKFVSLRLRGCNQGRAERFDKRTVLWPLTIHPSLIKLFAASHVSVGFFFSLLAPRLKHTTLCGRSRIHPCGTRSRCLYHCRNSPLEDRGNRCWGCAQGAHRGACFGCGSGLGSSFPLWGLCVCPPCRPSRLWPCVRVCSRGKWCLPRVSVSNLGCLCSSCPRRPPAARGAAARLSETPSACPRVPGTVWCSSRLGRSDAAACNRRRRGSAGGSGIKCPLQPLQ